MDDTVALDKLVPVIGQLAGRYAAGDLGLLDSSIDGMRDGRPLLQCPRLTASLQFEGIVSQQRKILLGLVKRKRSERMARLVIDMTAEAAFRTADKAPGRPEMVVGVPSFMVPQPFSTTFMLRLPDGRRLFINVVSGENWKETVAALVGSGHVSLRNIDVDLVACILWTIATWPRSSPSQWRPLAAQPVRPAAETIAALSRLLADQVVGHAEGEAGGSSAEARKRLEPVIDRRMLFHRLSRLEARLEVTLDQDGEIATDPKAEEVQRYDVRYRLNTASTPQRLELVGAVPDLLVDGQFHDMVLAGLREAPAELVEAASEFVDGTVTAQDIRALVEDAVRARSIVIARIIRKVEGKDKDLFLLKGTMGSRAAEMIFTADLKLGRRDDEAPATLEEIEDFEVHGFRDGPVWLKFGTDGKFRHDKSLRFIHRMMTMLVGWQALIG